MDCPTCGKSFDTDHAVKIHHTKAHGESIAGEAVSCATCGESFRVYPSRAERSDRLFCSDACKGEAYEDRVELVCDHCGASFDRRRSHAEGATRHYCSTECKGKAYRDRVEVTCSGCGKQFERQRAVVQRYERLYCSDDCRDQHERGANHPRWKGGDGLAVALRRILGGETWRSVRDEVHENRDSTCRMCGREESRNGSRLQIHHIVPVMAGGSHHRENLMLLCHRCHRHAEAFTNKVLTYPIAELVDE